MNCPIDFKLVGNDILEVFIHSPYFKWIKNIKSLKFNCIVYYKNFEYFYIEFFISFEERWSSELSLHTNHFFSLSSIKIGSYMWIEAILMICSEKYKFENSESFDHIGCHKKIFFFNFKL
jgi:hypothetical protein